MNNIMFIIDIIQSDEPYSSYVRSIGSFPLQNETTSEAYVGDLGLHNSRLSMLNFYEICIFIYKPQNSTAYA